MSSSTQKRSQSRNFPRTFPLRPGAILPELGRLTNLKELDLSGNALSGTFADSLLICVCPVLHKKEAKFVELSFCPGIVPEGEKACIPLMGLQFQKCLHTRLKKTKRGPASSFRRGMLANRQAQPLRMFPALSAHVPALSLGSAVTEAELRALLPGCSHMHV